MRHLYEIHRKREGIMITIQTKAKCVECARVFNLMDEDDAGEWYYGHDCEV
jgi:hypothetical protein